MSPKRIAVVGGGTTGMVVVKCLKEDSLDPVCYEKTNHLVGLWRYHDDDVEGVASVMKTTVINTSKEVSAFSDFPPSPDLPNYMHHRQVYQMFIEYARDFDLEKHVRFNKEVVEVKKADDYDATGRLVVTVKDTKTQEVTSDTYDGVVVCIGHHVYPNMPTFPGMDEFRGKILHTHSLKTVDDFNDQVVVVVGTGNSGMDAAVEISSVAKQVYLSTRRGAWLLPRLGPSGLPIDLTMLTRFNYTHFILLPYNWSCWFMEKMLNARFDHSMYNMKPKHRVFSQHPTVSDALPVKLLCGTVAVRKNVHHFVPEGVVFENEDGATPCDTVVLATGYHIRFPFISEDLTITKDNVVHLYKYVYPPHLKHPTLAIGGLVQTYGAGFPVFEAQARWMAQVFIGQAVLPSQSEMEADILKKKEENSKRYTASKRHTIQADYIPYLDEIYSLIGAKPNLWKIFFTDPILFFMLFFGPFLPYQYRLQGPHPWPGARKTILEWKKRFVKPLNNDYKSREDTLTTTFVISFVAVLAMIVFLFLI